MTRSCGDTEAGCGSPGTPHISHSGWATRETPAALPVMPCSSPPVGNRCGPSPQHQTCRQECLQRNRGTAVRNVARPVPVICCHEAELWVGTWGVGLEVSYRWSSTHGDELGPKLGWFLKNQKDPQSLEWGAAWVPGERQIWSTLQKEADHRRIFTAWPACFKLKMKATSTLTH